MMQSRVNAAGSEARVTVKRRRSKLAPSSHATHKTQQRLIRRLRLEASDVVTPGCPQDLVNKHKEHKKNQKITVRPPWLLFLELRNIGPRWYTSVPPFTQTERRSSTKPWSKPIEEADRSEMTTQELRQQGRVS
ncbi:hypothetical protein Bca101_099875 [Brassica carinata]